MMKTIKNFDTITYNEYLNQIINTRGQHNITEGSYYEKHHIIPRCGGGEPNNYGDRPEYTHHKNIIWLYPAEHLIAHYLLYKENQEDIKLARAFLFMSKDLPELIEDKDLIVYNQLREKASRLIGSMNANRIGSDESRAKLSQSLKTYYNSHDSYGKGILRDDDFKNKISKANSGENNGMFGKHHSDEAKQKISEHTFNYFKNNEVHRYNNGVDQVMASCCPEGFSPGRLSFKHKHPRKSSKGHNLKKYIGIDTDGREHLMDRANATKGHPEGKLKE